MNIISSLFTFIAELIGNVTMGTTATTLTGAIAEHESDISTINTTLTSVLANAMTTVGETVESETDLNSLSVGNYVLSNSYSSYTNAPEYTSTGAKLMVIPSNATSRQINIIISRRAEVFIRCRQDASTWTTWRSI